MESRRSQESEKRASEILRRKEIIDENMSRFYETIGTVSRNIRKGDWAYLHRHPEIRAIIRCIVNEAVKENPENIFTFAAKIFECANNQELVLKINEQLRWIDEQNKMSTLSNIDQMRQFSESSEVSLDEKEVNCPQSFKDKESKTVETNSEKICPDAKDAMCPENMKPTCSHPKI